MNKKTIGIIAISVVLGAFILVCSVCKRKSR